MGFKTWLESKIFNQFPSDAKQLIDQLYTMIPQMDVKTPTKLVGQVQDPFSDKPIQVYVMNQEDRAKRGWSGQGNTQRLPDGSCVIYFFVPMTYTDTIYHEFVHAYDPKFRKMKQNVGQTGGFQNAKSPVELDGFMSGKIYDAYRRMMAMDDSQKRKAVQDIMNWLKNPKQHNPELDPYSVPAIFDGLAHWHLYDDPKIWRQFSQRVYAHLIAPFVKK